MYHNKAVDENNRTRQLRHILFEPSPVYAGATLFEKFDDDVQQQIKVFLGRLVHMLQEALDLLEARHINPEGKKKPLTSPLLSPSFTSQSRTSLDARSSSPRSWKLFPKQSMSLLKWSFQDKKRTEEILREFSDLNSRIHESVKLWCLASSIGLDMQHLKRLQNDENAKQLGFDIDATLQITAAEAGQTDVSFELQSSWLDDLQNVVPGEQWFTVVQHKGRSYLMDRRYNESNQSQSGELDDRTRLRINDLAGLLSQPKEKVFCIPRCVGWKYLSEKDYIAFLFETPESRHPCPISLYELQDMKTVKPTLGQRFRLALALAKCITQLQMVKWVSIILS